ncbi:MAG: DUF3810 family protein [Myxococcota bacterium]
MERIVIPGRATYTPVALTDVLAGTAGVRLLLGATVAGTVVQSAAFGYYAGSAARDYVARSRVRPIAFRDEFDADVDRLDEMPTDMRELEVQALSGLLNRDYTAARPTRAALAQTINARLTAWIGGITGQEVVTSSEIRSFSFAKVLFPFALGTCDVISGDVAIFQDLGILEPHVIAHEFCHRKGYLKELHAQVIAYLALRTSDDPVLVQSARAERLHRQLTVASGHDPDKFALLVDSAGLRPELRSTFAALQPAKEAGESAVGKVMRTLYEQRMRLTGQNGLSDYDRGFTNFLWTFGRSTAARHDRSAAAL